MTNIIFVFREYSETIKSLSKIFGNFNFFIENWVEKVK